MILMCFLLQLLYCRGALVNLLTQSNCGRYLEFKAINKIFTHMNGKTEQVCSSWDRRAPGIVGMKLV